MITDNETNTVYFSTLVPKYFPNESKNLFAIIEEAGYQVKQMEKTNDYYCRDYMPVQVAENDFVQFVFRPKAYFKPKEYIYLTNPVLVELMNELPQPRYSPLILDGGNIVKTKSKAIITDRVFKDNMFQFSEENILKQLENDLKCQVIIIPEYPHEITGHADGLIRFINENTVLINETNGEKEDAWSKSFLNVLTENQLRPKKVPCLVTATQKTANGLYINYLHVGNLIVFPQFNMKEDDRAFQTFKDVFYDKTVIPFDARWIAKYGGVFNCSTWTIKA